MKNIKKMQKKITSIIVSFGSDRLFVFLGILTTFPLIILSFFNNPASDDFDFSYKTLLFSFYDAQIWRYHNEGGRYFANAILSLNPLVFKNYYLFKIIPIIVILFFVFCLNFFISNIFKDNNKEYKISVVCFLFFLFIVQLPDVCQGFYWITGAITYQLPLSLSLLFFGFLIRFYQNRKTINLIISILILFLTVGCNEIVVFCLLLILSSIFTFKFSTDRKLSIPILIVLIFLIGYTLIEVLAPGNSVRGTLIKDNHKLIPSIFKSFLFSFRFILEWSPLILICCLFFIDKFNNIIKSSNKQKFINPFIVLLLLFTMIFISIFAGFWNLTEILPERALNVLYFYYIFIFLYFVCCILWYLNQKYSYTILLSKEIKMILGLIIFISAFSKTPIFLSYHDLLIGKAYHYNKEMKNRFELIKKCKEKRIILPALVHKPPTIYHEGIMGITSDNNNWKNLEISLYYNKEIIVKPKDSIFTE